MSSELEGLIATLLVYISCAGEQGCSVKDVVDVIHDPSGLYQGLDNQPEVNDATSRGNRAPNKNRRMVRTVWKWLAARRDVSVGVDRQYNHLDLDDVLGLSLDPNSAMDQPDISNMGGPPASHNPNSMRVYTSEETMWEALTGHAIDYKRVPRSEWLLLLGIASTRSKGILQGDLGRLVDQDKRSVPKRTDALLKKGYIAKRTTLVRGTKTSKMWLKLFTPPLPKDGDSVDEHRIDMNLSRQVLLENLDPVPWHVRWTGESVDYTALATTIIAIAKEWGVLRLQDLKLKLGVLGMRWQMKVLAKVCRFLNARGVIQYVAAKLDEKVFKDCIKYVRELNSEDWSIYLATGKRATKPTKRPDLSMGDLNDVLQQLPGQHTSLAEVASAPPWSADKPLSSSIIEMAQRQGEFGLTNPDVYALSLGTSFSRYLSSMTTALSTPGLQPPHLEHFQMRSEHTRVGKIASYRYFAPRVTSNADGNVHHDSSAQPSQSEAGKRQDSCYGFGSRPTSTVRSTQAVTLSDLCFSRTNNKAGNRKPRGRPKVNRESQQLPEIEEPTEATEETTEATGQSSHEFGEPKRSPAVNESTNSPQVAKTLATASENSSRPRRTGRRKSYKPQELNDSEGGNEEPAKPVVEEEEEAEQTLDIDQATPIKRGRSGRAAQGRLSKNTDPSRRWKCEKCGGTWKNDIGLKYHLEKSRTACNPSYEESPRAPIRRSRKSLAAIEREHVRLTPAAARTPTISTPSKEQLNSDAHKSGDEAVSDVTIDVKSVSISSSARPSPRPSVRLTGNHSTATPEWRRPSSMSFNDAIPSNDMGTGSGALVQSEEGQPRPVLGLSERISSTPKPRPALDRQKETDGETYPTESAYPLTPELYRSTSLTVSERAGMDRGQFIKTGRAPSNRELLTERIRGVIFNLLEEQSGVFPGGAALWHAISVRWKETFPEETNPALKESQAGLRGMLKAKTAADHWHAFRDNKGMFSKCQIIVLPTVDPFSPVAMQLVDKIKAVHPSLYVPPPFGAPELTAARDGRRGRRSLGVDVETLNAPVYAAQLAAKGKGDDDFDEIKPMKRRFRYKPAPQLNLNLTDVAPRPKMDFGRTSHNMATSGDALLQVTPLKSISEMLPGDGIRFLEPNTFLEEEEPQTMDGQHGTLTRLYSVYRWDGQGPRRSRTGQGIDFQPATNLQGWNGSWPYLSLQVFEKQECSYTLDGWLPDTQWFFWASFNQEVEKRFAGMAGRKRKGRTTTTQYRIFIKRLKACMAVERSWTDSFTSAWPHIAGPHNIFIRFFSPEEGHGSMAQHLRWLAEDQLTNHSFYGWTDGYDSSTIDIESDEESPKRIRRPQNRERGAAGVGARMESGQLARTKRVRLATRKLTSISSEELQHSTAAELDISDDPNKTLAAFVAVRVLLGGCDKSIDWGLLLKLFPGAELQELRRFWINARKEQGNLVTRLTKDFQDKFLAAYERDELPEIDFDEPLSWDWKGLIEWTLKLSRGRDIQLPSTNQDLHSRFSKHNAARVTEDWREGFFHAQSSVYSRFEGATSVGTAVAVDRESWRTKTLDKELDVARSWVRSLCHTSETQYSTEAIRNKFSGLIRDDPDGVNGLLERAIDDLTQRRVICRSRKPPLGGRPYRLNESYTSTIEKLAQRTKFEEAIAFKRRLDAIFRRGETLRLPSTINDGSVMALSNLHAWERISLTPIDVPYVPFGFEPGNYESRKFPKSYYHFGVEVAPTDRYEYDEDIAVLQAAAREGPPVKGRAGELPQWVDFFGNPNAERWSDILGACCFLIVTRGICTAEPLCSAMKPVLEEFEADMIIDWGKRTGLMKGTAEIEVAEWWWLAVPWQR